MKFLEISNISKAYKKEQVIKGISFSIKEREIVGLLGLNGAGKSTTIEMIATLQKPDSGNIYYKEIDIIKQPEFIRRELGYVPQNIILFEELTGYQNLEFWGKAYGLKGQELKVAIKRTVNLCQLEDKIKLPVKTYSGGMKRRINIGVALLHMPQILILDEAMVGIDIVSVNKILALLKELNETYGVAVIFTTHNMAEAEYICDRFLILDKGKILSDISSQEILKNHLTVQEYFLKLILKT